MAERRMFAKTIIDSDAFLDMPLSTQALYFHLSMRADDDGFINNPKKIQRMIGGADDDLRLLLAKRFLIPFESGVCVIKHWLIHNYIRNDRYKPTVYQEEKNQLDIKENRAYTLNPAPSENVGIPDGRPLVDQTETQVRLGKDRIGKGRLGEDRIEDTEGAIDAEVIGYEEAPDYIPTTTTAPYEQIKSLYNSICVSLSKCTAMSDHRKKAIKARLSSGYTLDDFRRLFEKAESSAFLKGKNQKNWRATFDWLICDANMAKTLDGNYDDQPVMYAQPYQQQAAPQAKTFRDLLREEEAKRYE